MAAEFKRHSGKSMN